MSTSELITIMSFVVLAALTAWYAYQTQELAIQAKAAIDAAQRSAESAERMLQLESLPIVWGRTSSVASGGHQGAEVEVIVHNVGRGVALDVTAAVAFQDGSVRGPLAMASELTPTTGGAAQRTRMSINQHKQMATGDFSVKCEFSDAAGRRYQTRGRGSSAEVVEMLGDGNRTQPAWRLKMVAFGLQPTTSAGDFVHGVGERTRTSTGL
jgi:hypothetical protein